MKRKTGLVVLVSACVLVGVAGCNSKFWDPTQVGRFRPVPAVNVILDSLGVADETPAAWETGEEPRPADVLAYETDYIFGPGDIVGISIFELFNEGAMYTGQLVITETGKLSIPDVGVVEAAGLTESQLEEEVKQILAPNILKEPSVSVTLLKSESRMFSILGTGIPRPSRYDIPRYDFRLADALAIAGGISQFNTSYVYVSRPITGQEPLTPAAPGQTAPAAPKSFDNGQIPQSPEIERKVQPVKESGDDMLDIIAPSVHTNVQGVVVASTEMVTDEELIELNRIASPEDLSLPDTRYAPALVQKTAASNAVAASRKTSDRPLAASSVGQPAAGGESRIEWIFQDGRWVPVQIPSAKPVMEKQTETPVEPSPPSEQVERKPASAGRTTAWDQIGAGGAERRAIRIPADKLLSGDPRYNIVVRPGDTIHVPLDIIGEYCIMGNVNAQGFVNMTGRPLTLKMAVAAAGGLGPLAWPKRCEVVRRIGKKQEEIVMVDLDKIASGEQPDFFIKPNDLINVGTHPTSSWRYVLRNAFRTTYGFGFIYDRNFADRDVGTARPFDFTGFF